MLAGPVKAVTERASRRHVARRVVAVSGLEHVPRTGPFILVPNHSSFYDHFVMGAVMDAWIPSTTWFPTKAESFDKRLSRSWHVLMHAIPLDRERPSPETLRTFDRVLAQGDVLCVYPEGTRGPGWPLLPFKDGAFTFAVRGSVPTIPVGIDGANDVLPKGSRRTTRASVRVAFGPALPDDQAAPRRERMRTLRSAAEAAIPALIEQARASDARSLAPAHAALVNRIIDESLDSTAHLAPADLVRLERLLDLLDDGSHRLDAYAVTRLRLQGLRATNTAFPGKLRRGLALGRQLRRELPRHGDDPMAHYLQARWHLGMPRALGGDPDQALQSFRAAAALAPATDTRYLMGVAEAAARAGNHDEAGHALAAVVRQTPRTGRGEERVARAERMLATLPQPGSPALEQPSLSIGGPS